jgi:hypothetical protein
MFLVLSLWIVIGTRNIHFSLALIFDDFPPLFAEKGF